MWSNFRLPFTGILGNHIETDRQRKDIKPVGYGAMLIEGLVAVLALLAIACYGKPSDGATPFKPLPMALHP